MTAVKDLTDDDAAILAVRLIDRVGMPAIRHHLAWHVITPPPPGRALLACWCGRVLDADQMHRYTPPGARDHTAVIRPITCLEHST